MKTIKIDLHGDTVEEALARVEDALCDNVNNRVIIKAITGKGDIRKALQQYLDQVGVKWRFQLGNDGCIIMEI